MILTCLKEIGLIHSEKYDNSRKTKKYSRCNNEEIIEQMSTKNILYYYYYISHDGYDELGPKSNIYNLFFITDEDKLYHYSYEDWFCGVNPISFIKCFDLYEEQQKLTEYCFLNYLPSDEREEIIQYVNLKNSSR